MSRCVVYLLTMAVYHSLNVFVYPNFISVYLFLVDFSALLAYFQSVSMLPKTGVGLR